MLGGTRFDDREIAAIRNGLDDRNAARLVFQLRRAELGLGIILADAGQGLWPTAGHAEPLPPPDLPAIFPCGPNLVKAQLGAAVAQR